MILRFNLLGRKRTAVNKTLVLMYHRVASLTLDPWQLAVSPENFEQQLQFLKQNYKIISISELAENLNRKAIEPKTVCLTFDDGYSDNYFIAKPLLEKYECPAAFFIASQYIERRQTFWWDELDNVILNSPELPRLFAVKINKKLFEFDLKHSSSLSPKQKEQHRAWVWYQKPLSRRCELYHALYEKMICLPYADLRAALQKIKYWAKADKVSKNSLPMTIENLQGIANQSLFEVGLHTNTHTALSFQPKEIQHEEVVDNQQWLKDNCNKITKALAYPNGRFNDETISVAKEQNLIAAFTTNEQSVTNSSEQYRLGRFQVKNWSPRQFKRQLRQWTDA